MVRHKGIGMNRAKKKKVELSGMVLVRLMLRGYVPECTPVPEEGAAEGQHTLAHASPGKVSVNWCKQQAKIAMDAAKSARKDAACLQREHDKRQLTRDYKTYALEHARRTNDKGVLRKREEKRLRLLEDELHDDYILRLHLHSATSVEKTAFEVRALALEAELARHKRLQRRVKKS